MCIGFIFHMQVYNHKIQVRFNLGYTGLCRAVVNMSGNRYESDCRFGGREFHHGPVPYFHGD